jgi:hypothetical protein
MFIPSIYFSYAHLISPHRPREEIAAGKKLPLKLCLQQRHTDRFDFLVNYYINYSAWDASQPMDI